MPTPRAPSAAAREVVGYVFIEPGLNDEDMGLITGHVHTSSATASSGMSR